VLVSILGLTVFVKHQINWLSLSLTCPQGKKKTVKRQRPQVFSVFAPYWSKSLQMHSLSLSLFIKKHIFFTGYKGDKSLFHQESPFTPSTGVLPLAVQALLVTLIKLFLNYKPSASIGEPGLPGSQGKQASQNR
jgi:hypothetical protein